MTEETQNDFDNILVPKGLNSMMDSSNQDLLTFIQNHTTQNNNTRYQGVQNSNMQTPNNPNFVTNKNETQFFPSQEPSSTTQEQRLESFDHNYNTQELAIPKEPYPFDSQVPFHVTTPNHKRFTNMTIPILDQSLIFMKEGNNIKAVHRHCRKDTPSQFLKLYQVQNWQDEKDPETITTKNNCMESPIRMSTQSNKETSSIIVDHSQKQTQPTRQNPKDKHRAKPQGSTPTLKQTSSKRKEDTPSPILFSTDKQKTVIVPPHKRTSRNINSSKYAKLRAILEELEDQEHSPKSPHSKNKKENKTLHHFQIEVANIMKEDMSRLIEKCKSGKPKKSS